MERIAIPVWQGRVSPVMDSARKLWICDLGVTQEETPRVIDIGPVDIRQRTEFIRNLGVVTLLCGAVSRPLYNLLIGAGITVWPWLAGKVDEVLKAYCKGGLHLEPFQLPGCQRRRHHARQMRNRGWHRKQQFNEEEL